MPRVYTVPSLTDLTILVMLRAMNRELYTNEIRRRYQDIFAVENESSLKSLMNQSLNRLYQKGYVRRSEKTRSEIENDSLLPAERPFRGYMITDAGIEQVEKDIKKLKEILLLYDVCIAKK